ncbi:MAG: hypothetical protein R3C42_09575 [Parvularculaceae bacterium]
MSCAVRPVRRRRPGAHLRLFAEAINCTICGRASAFLWDCAPAGARHSLDRAFILCAIPPSGPALVADGRGAPLD